MKLRITSALTVANHHSYETATLIPVPVPELQGDAKKRGHAAYPIANIMKSP